MEDCCNWLLQVMSYVVISDFHSTTKQLSYKEKVVDKKIYKAVVFILNVLTYFGINKSQSTKYKGIIYICVNMIKNCQAKLELRVQTTKGYPTSCTTNYLPWNSLDWKSLPTIHAYFQVVYFNCVKFHQSWLISLGEVALISHLDVVCVGIKLNSLLVYQYLQYEKPAACKNECLHLLPSLLAPFFLSKNKKHTQIILQSSLLF